MKLILLLTSLAAGVASFAQSQPGPAIPTEALEWTSNDNRTIRARFVGAGSDRVLIEMQGCTFVVPFSRLSAQSVAQARRLRGFASDGKAVTGEPPLAAPTPRAQLASIRHAPRGLGQPLMPGAAGMSLHGRVAAANAGVPEAVQRAINAGNVLQTKPYKYGGGRAPLEDTGYDCSGSVSYVLIKAGMLESPLTSRSFANYGEPGPGRWLTIYSRPGHVFMTVCGLRLDTGGRGGSGESGPRWNLYPRSASGWIVRHPSGF